MIELRHVGKVFGSGRAAVRAVDDLSFNLPQGAFWTLMGPSGSGKSTVLHLIAGLTALTEGHMLIDDVDVATIDDETFAVMRRRRIGYVLQSFNLLQFLTAEQNVAMPLILDGGANTQARDRAQRALELVDMGHRASHKPSELSGGEQQRVAIARALVIEPAIILADEPTGNLDRENGRAIMSLIQDINEDTGVTILMVTHDPGYAVCSQKVLRLVDGKLDQEMELAALDA